MKKTILHCAQRACILAAAVTFTGLSAAKAGETGWTNLVSDIPGVARYPDANLVDPIGVVPLPGGTVVVADNGAGLVSIYNPSQTLDTSKFENPGSIAIPTLTVGGTSAPTGLVFNPKAYVIQGGAIESSTTSFVAPSGFASQLLVATEEGTVVGVNLSGSTAEVAYTGANAAYKGIALSGTGGADGQLLYLANFKNGTVDVLNESFQPVTLSATTAITFSGTSNPAISAGCRPFNVKAFSLKCGAATFRYLFVTYTLPDPNSNGMDDLRGPGGAGDGYVLAFDPAGNYKGVIATSGTTLAASGATTTATGASILSSPWGMALLHARNGGTLFVGNVADGTVQAFDLAVDATGDIVSTPGGPLIDVEGNPFQVQDLWGLHFGASASVGWIKFIGDTDQLVEDSGSLYFSAGIAGELHGLLGRIYSRQVVELPRGFEFGKVKLSGGKK